MSCSITKCDCHGPVGSDLKIIIITANLAGCPHKSFDLIVRMYRNCRREHGQLQFSGLFQLLRFSLIIRFQQPLLNFSFPFFPFLPDEFLIDVRKVFGKVNGHGQTECQDSVHINASIGGNRTQQIKIYQDLKNYGNGQ